MSILIKINSRSQSKRTFGSKVRHRAELWDQMHLIFQQYNDHQIHGVLYFDGLLDFDCLQKAILITMKKVPELSSRYVEGCLFPYWEEINLIEDEIITFTESQNEKAEIEAFITSQTDTFAGPQLKVRVIRGEVNDTMCVVMNHMMCDGAGFKEYLYMLAEAYTNVKRNNNFAPACESRGSRSTKQIVKQIRFKNRIKALLMPDSQPKKTGQLSFPLSGEVGETPCFLTYKMESDRFIKLKQYSKKENATINDLVLAAFIRALCTMLDVQDCTHVTIPCVMDLRRYLPNRKAAGVCNLTSTILCDIDFKEEESFNETVSKVKRVMDRQKNHLPGLKGLLQLDLIFSLFPYKVVKNLIGRHYINPLICLSNIGVIEGDQLIFDTLQIKDAVITGAVKYYPYFLLALSSFRDSITFTVCLKGIEKDRQKVAQLFDLLDYELKLD